jgi:hypothetical protein
MGFLKTKQKTNIAVLCTFGITVPSTVYSTFLCNVTVAPIMEQGLKKLTNNRSQTTMCVHPELTSVFPPLTNKEKGGLKGISKVLISNYTAELSSTLLHSTVIQQPLSSHVVKFLSCHFFYYT